jgi:hypothetical protein
MLEKEENIYLKYGISNKNNRQDSSSELTDSSTWCL